MINGDNLSGFWPRVMYFPQCLIGYLKGSGNPLSIRTVKLDEGDLRFCKGSPSRIFCDLFWRKLNYSTISDTLGSRLNFFDIGCGKGHYGLMLKELAADKFGSYTGLDIYKSEDFPSKFQHYISDTDDIDRYISDDVNFVISQSALEHIQEDIHILKICASKLSSNKGFVQIHMVPAPSSLWLYLWHGWRQYSEKNLSNIAMEVKNINPNLNVFAVPLAGKASFFIHLFKFTMPLILLYLKKQKGWRWEDFPSAQEEALSAVRNDLQLSSTRFNSFWALIISTEGVNFGLDFEGRAK